MIEIQELSKAHVEKRYPTYTGNNLSYFLLIQAQRNIGLFLLKKRANEIAEAGLVIFKPYRNKGVLTKNVILGILKLEQLNLFQEIWFYTVSLSFQSFMKRFQEQGIRLCTENPFWARSGYPLEAVWYKRSREWA